MAIVPDKALEQIEFCESHIPVWTLSPTTIGLSAAQCTALAAQTGAARSAYNKAQAQRQTAKAATQNFQNSLTTMKGTVSDMIKSIKSFAANAANPGAVYTAAEIPEPLPPSPRPKPGAPEGVTVGLNAGGSITLRWKAKNASPTSGAVFNVSRRIGADGAYASIGPAQGGPRGGFEFTDDTLPLGATQVSYIMQGFRGTQVGEAGEAVTVQFGVGGGGGLALAGVQGAKRAAA